MEYAVETIALTKTFSDWWGRNKVCAVDDLDLRIRPNEVFGLLGPNGSGKTTTIKMLLGLLYPTKGKALCFGSDATDPEVSMRIGFLPEESYLYRYLTASETLDFYGRLFKLPAKIRRLRTEALLDMVGLKAVANRQVGTFSKGMARRIGLAQALINDPDLLILDEPTTGLDPIGTRQIKDLIIELARRGKTILLCSHLLADVEDVCDRIAILYGGKIQAEGHVRELLQRTDKTEIVASSYLSHGAVSRIESILKDEKVDFAVTSPMDKLETFFINIVTQAQQQQLPTAGAESKTDISEFLTTGRKPETARILDQLVSASLEPPATQSQELPTTKPAPAKAPQPDDDLLKKLTAKEKSQQSKPVKRPPQHNEPQEQPKPDQDILDRLTGRPDAGKTTDTSPGDSQDA